MKKNYFAIAAFFLAVFMTLSFVSCSDNDDKTDDSAAAVFAGEFNGKMNLFVDASKFKAENFDADTTLTVKFAKSNDNAVDISIPAITVDIAYLGMKMEVSEFKISSVPVEKVAGSDISAKIFTADSFTSPVTYKSRGQEQENTVKVQDIDASVVNGHLTLKFTWTIGKMPVEIVSTFIATK